MRAAVLVLAMMLVGSMVAAPDAHGADGLEELFARADADPAAVVPLVVAGSRAITGLDADRGILLAERLEPYCRRVFFTSERLPGMAAAQVLLVPAGDDTAWAIGRRYHIGDHLVLRLNARAPARRAADADVDVDDAQDKVIDARTQPVTVVVALARHRLLLWLGGTLLGIYPIASGAPGHPTPLGRTRIRERVRDPEWRDPATGRIYGPKDPGNFLGGYWLGFAALDSRQFRGIGIHGWTAEEEGAWVGHDASHGCIRMRATDLPDVFDLALPGAAVSIRP